MSKRYFNNLNYSFGDEDSSVEMGILPPDRKTICVVAGSGGRVLPLLVKRPSNIICVDILSEQLYLTEIRVAAMRVLNHIEYCAFWGIPGTEMSTIRRREIFKSLTLSKEASVYLETIFEKNKWESILLVGKFEQTLITLSKINKWITGTAGRELFHQPTLAAQQAYAKEKFPHFRWKIVLSLLGNSTVLNSLLYKGDFPKKNIPGSTYKNFKRIFDTLFFNTWLRRSFFAQLCFFGELVYPEAALIECSPEYFDQIQSGALNCTLEFEQGDVLRVIQKSKEKIDFVSLSDVPSFFKGPMEKNYLQAIRDHIVPQGKIVVRGNLRVTQPHSEGFTIKQEEYQDLFRAESTQLWKVDVYEKEISI